MVSQLLINLYAGFRQKTNRLTTGCQYIPHFSGSGKKFGNFLHFIHLSLDTGC